MVCRDEEEEEEEENVEIFGMKLTLKNGFL